MYIYRNKHFISIYLVKIIFYGFLLLKSFSLFFYDEK